MPPMRPFAFMVASVFLGTAFLTASAPAAADCAPPCGPIPVVIEMKTSGEKYATFGATQEMTFDGTVSFYVNVDGDGFWYDPQNKPKITFKINRQPPWVSSKVEPPSYDVPVDDPQYLKNEGSPDQVQFFWEAPIKITVKKLRDPTADELAVGSSFIRRDGSFRVVVAASSTSSVLAPDLLGPTNGLQEGYGVKELRFIPEIAGVQWLPDASGALQPGGKSIPAKGASPGLAGVGTLVLAGLVAVGLGRRRR